MRLNFQLLIKLILFSCFFFLSKTFVSAQNSNLLYGVTSRGGADNAGVIFHIDKATGEQTVDYSFPVLIPGKSPYGDLTDGSNGKFYGMTSSGGANDQGEIFEWDPATNSFTVKINFNGTDKGRAPIGSLTFTNGKFYGLASAGGANNNGVIFEWDPVSNIFIKKIDFDGSSKGRQPKSSLTLYNGKFYGVTYMGGVNDNGVIFEWDPVTNIYTKKFDFDITATGRLPQGSLTLHNGKFYGMASKGGVNNDSGVLYEWDPVSNIFLKKFDFNTANNTGIWPVGALTSFNNKLYGMTPNGGITAFGNGVIFEWDPATNIYTKWFNFGSSGSYPQGSLTLLNGQFFGTTEGGGLYELGTIFKWDPATNIYTKMVDLNPTADANRPKGSLTLRDGLFYGMTNYGGSNDIGTIFGWDPAANIFTKKIDFLDAPSGSTTYGSLTLAGTRFYGLTHSGGTNGDGVIFEWEAATNTYTKKIDFNSTFTGSHPYGTLAFFNGKYYGVTSQGGTYDRGVIFEWDPIMNNCTKKIDFDGASKGSWPESSMTLYHGKFYGMTSQGGVNSIGVIYEWDPTTNIFTKKIDFDGANKGSTPEGDLILIGGKFYGMNENGGANELGVIFEWDPSSNVFTKKIDFNGSEGGIGIGSLAFNNGKLFGMTYYGGANNKGVIFEWNPATNEYVKRLDFDGISKGRKANGTLTLNSGKFYGMTYIGGVNDIGVIFEWNPVDDSFNKLLDFNSINGRYPYHTQLVVYNDSTTAAQATNIYFNNVQSTQLNFNWVDGNGAKRAVFMQQGTDGTAAPLNNTTYIADTVFGSGTQVGTTGWYCIFNGTTHNSGVAVTNLLPNTTYRVMVSEYIGIAGFEQYNTNTAEGNPANQNTPELSYTINTFSNPAPGGTTSGDGIYSYGSTATVKALSSESWEFYEWTENGNPFSANPDYSFLITSGRELTAVFYKPGKQYVTTTIAEPLEGGYITGGGTYYSDSLVTVNATAYAGWEFVNWTEDGLSISLNPTYEYTVSNHRSLTANFQLYTVLSEPDTKSIRVFPNPTRDKLFVEWDNAPTLQFDEVSLLNSLSQPVYDQKTGNNTGKMTIDVKGLTSGIYHLILSEKGHKVAVSKVLILP